MRQQFLDVLPYVDPIPALKQQLAAELVRIMQGWTTMQIIFTAGIDQPRVSDLRRGKLDRFSVETLIRYLTRLGHNVTLTVAKDPPRRQRDRASGHVS